MPTEPSQTQIDTLRGELREEKEVVAALEESKADCERLLSKKIEELSQARQRWEQEVRERLETKAKALNTRAEARFEDGDQQEANQLIAFATGIQIALDLIFGEAEQVGGDDV